MVKDFNNSLEQLLWNHASAEHQRKKEAVAKLKPIGDVGKKLLDRFKSDIIQLESKYPSLKN